MELALWLSTGALLFACFVLFRTIQINRRQAARGPIVELPEGLARQHLELSKLFSETFLAARDVIALCPSCDLDSSEQCRCDERRQRLALAVTAVEDFVAESEEYRALRREPPTPA